MKRVGALLACLLSSLILGAAATAPCRAADLPVGETLVYDISYLWFDRLAEGRLSFVAGAHPGTFQAELEAKTLGVAAWLTNERIHRYVSLMKQGEDGRLHSLRYETLIIKGKGKSRQERSKLYLFDEDRGEVRYRRSKNGKAGTSEILPLDGPRPNDLLTAFYNFRAGVFGPLQPGSRYRIPTFSREGESEIVVETIADDERHNYPFFPRHGLLAQVTVDQEVFDTGGGHVYVWFDPAGRPARGIVEKVIGLGDVRGSLRGP